MDQKRLTRILKLTKASNLDEGGAALYKSHRIVDSYLGTDEGDSHKHNKYDPKNFKKVALEQNAKMMTKLFGM